MNQWRKQKINMNEHKEQVTSIIKEIEDKDAGKK